MNEPTVGRDAWQGRTALHLEDGDIDALLDRETPAPAPLVAPELLSRAGKILFIAHLALGDFTYLQACFRAMAQAFPQLELHLWVDERRRTHRAAEWECLRKYVLYDWLDACPFFEKVYKETYSPALLHRSIAAAQAEDYPIVVSLAVLERHRYARLARHISPRGFVVGQKKRVRPYDLPKRLCYRKLDAFIPAYVPSSASGRHISDIYADWFSLLFGLHVAPAARFPHVAIPQVWTERAQAQCREWGLGRVGGGKGPLVFLNAFSKSIERNWPLERVIELVLAVQAHPAWRDAGFVVNVVPEALERARALFARQGPPRTQLFSAEENFFQLPAMLGLCELVVSVETAVMHLANAVHVPVIALMRRKNPEWAPIDRANSRVITVRGRDDWVERIGVEEVMAELAHWPPHQGRL